MCLLHLGPQSSARWTLMKAAECKIPRAWGRERCPDFKYTGTHNGSLPFAPASTLEMICGGPYKLSAQ